MAPFTRRSAIFASLVLALLLPCLAQAQDYKTLAYPTLDAALDRGVGMDWLRERDWYVWKVQQGIGSVNIRAIGGTSLSGANVVDAVNTAFRVNCVVGCGAASFTDNSAFTGGATAVNVIAGLFDTTPPAITDGNAGAVRMDGSRFLMVNCQVGCSGSSFADNAAFTFGTTSISIAGAVVDDTATNTVAENSAGAPRMNTNRILYSNPRNNAGTEIATSANPFRVDPTGTTTQPISGTVTITDGAGAVNVIVDSSALPAGASTLAEQQTQTTALQLIDNLPLAQGAATAGQNGVLAQGAVTTGAPTYTTGNTNPVSLTTAGGLRVDGSGTTQPVSGTVTVTDGAGALNVIVDSGSVTANAGTNLNTSALLLDATYTGRTPAGASPADNESNTNTALSRIGAFNYVFDGAAWDRWTGAVTGSGNFTVVQPTGTNLHIVCDGGTCGGASPFADNSAFTFGTSGIGVVGYVFDDVAPNAVTENNAAAPRMSGNRVPYSILRDAAGSERGANVNASNELTVLSNDTTASGSLTAVEQAVTLTLQGRAGAAALITGTWVATLAFEGSVDGTTWIGIETYAPSTASESVQSTTTVNGTFQFMSRAGFQQVRARVSAYTSGTLVVTLRATVSDDIFEPFVREDGAAIASYGAQLAANDGSTTRFLRAVSGAPVGTEYALITRPILSAGTATIGALVANQSVNVAQINGITPLMGNGVTGTGSQRVTIASDNTAFTTNVGTFPDNEPFNISQMNGVAVTMGNGVSGTGVQRVTIASDSTGTTIATQATAANLNATVVGTLAEDGVAAATNRVGTLPAVARSVYNSATSGNNTALSTGTLSGNLFIAQLPEPSIASYSASAVVASAASATDIAVIPGNATNTVLLTEVRVSCTATTAGIIQLHLIKRSTADTAGTSVAMTEVPDDANYAAASSALLTYTANPTLGGTVGDLDIVKLGCMATGTATPNDLYIANFRQKPIVLRGTAQQVAINLNGATVAGGSFAVTYKWIETVGP